METGVSNPPSSMLIMIETPSSSATSKSGDVEYYNYHLTVAYRENQIMEKYFPKTVRASNYELRPDQVAFLQEHVLPDYVYTSPVSAGLTTWCTERQLQGLLLLGIVAVGVIHRRSRPINA